MSNELPSLIADAGPLATEVQPSDPIDVKKKLDGAALTIGKATVRHLKEMYPEALFAVTKNAARSLARFVRNRINTVTFPLLEHARRVDEERSHSRQVIADLRRRLAEAEASGSARPRQHQEEDGPSAPPRTSANGVPKT